MTPSMSIDWETQEHGEIANNHESSNALLPQTTQREYDTSKPKKPPCKAKAKHEPESNTMAQTMQVLES